MEKGRKESSPKISIIMATLNRSHLIGETLSSIQGQSFKGWECLIIDDGSSDSTKKVVSDFFLKDKRFKYFSRPGNYTKGLSGARNFGLDNARGNYIIFFDDDDIVHPENLETCLKELGKSDKSFCRYEKKPFYDPSLISFTSVTNNFKRTLFSSTNIEDMVVGRIPFASCTVMWRAICFNSIRFNEELQYAEEWECYTRILLKGFKGISINEVLYFNRKHKASNTGEFHSKHPVRRESKIKASHLIINHLAGKKKISENIRKFFIRMGFDLNDFGVIKKILEVTETKYYKVLIYRLTFITYPLIRPLLRLKGEIFKG